MDYEVAVIGDVDSPNEAIRSLLHTTLTHVADFQVMILKIISEKFGHSMEELVEAVKEDKTFKESLLTNPATVTFLKTKGGKKVIVKSAGTVKKN
jgi:hypothetical protein